MSPTRAAKVLGVHINTVHTWCRKSVAGTPSKLEKVTRNPVNGYYLLDSDEVKALKSEGI